MRVSDFKQSKYMRKEDFPKPVVVTIRSYAEENVAMNNSKPQMKCVLYFDELDKGIVCNATRLGIAEAICGTDDLDKWTGHKIVVYADPTIRNQLQQVVGGIAFRFPKNAVSVPQARGFNPNGTRLPANFNPNTLEADEEQPPMREPGEDAVEEEV